MRGAVAVLALVLLCGCHPGAGAEGRCAPPERLGTLPDEVGESSGLAPSRWDGVFWTHNDSDGDATLYAIDTTGTVVGRVRVRGARNRDWEDLAAGPCPTGRCLYIADTGDNRLQRDDVAIYRVREPTTLGDTITEPAERFPLRFPSGPKDVEAIYVLPGGDVYLISKGRGSTVTLFRYPAPLRPNETVTVQEVQRLSSEPVGLPYQVTGASATPDGRWVVVRTYTAVQLYRPDRRGRLTAVIPAPGHDIQALAEPQGEAIALLQDGTIVLSSEEGPAGVPGTLGKVECRLD